MSNPFSAITETDLERPKTLVVGAGIGGIRAALDLAEAGCRVYLLESGPAMGGILAQLDHQFGDNHCGMCRLLPLIGRDTGPQFCLRRGLQHERITILTRTTLQDVTGPPSNLNVTLKKAPLGVDPLRCSGCGDCEAVCPVEVPDLFNAGLTKRKAVFTPVPYNDPHTRVIDWEACTRCEACLAACPHDAIRLTAEAEVIEMEDIDGVVLATGAERFDPGASDLYGFGVLPNVVTATGFERILSGSGPFGGKPLRPSDNKPLQKIAWIQCVGSRNLMIGADFCSNVCCMFALKEALLTREKIGPDFDGTIFYMDLRTYGRDFQRYRDRAEKESGVRLVRCRIHSIEPAETEGDLRITYPGVDGKLVEESFDMVVLSTGRKKGSPLPEYAEHEGVFVLSPDQQLIDISETVISASRAAGRLLQHIRANGSKNDPDPGLNRALESEALFDQKVRVLVLLDDRSVKVKIWDEIEAALKPLSVDLTVLRASAFNPDEANDPVKEALAKSMANRLILATFTPAAIKPDLFSPLPPWLVELVDLQKIARNMGEDANFRAQAVHEIEMAFFRLTSRTPRKMVQRPVEKRALVIGGGPAGLAAAAALARFEIPVVLIEKSDRLGGNLPHIRAGEAKTRVEKLVTEATQNPLITVYTQAEMIASSGRAGQFESIIRTGENRTETLRHGVVIVASGGKPAATNAYGLGSHPQIITQFELDQKLTESGFADKPLGSLVMIQCAGSREEPYNFCSRICCRKAVENGIRIKEIHPEAAVYVFYRDMMTYGNHEKQYTEARKKGVYFIPFDPGARPEVVIDPEGPFVKGYDPGQGETLFLKPDLIVPSTGLLPNPVAPLADIFQIPLTADGFIQEADSKWRPLDTPKAGIFVAGLARAPGGIVDVLQEGEAAALRAMQILAKEILFAQRVSARVRQALCSRCEACIPACPYEARFRDPVSGEIQVDPSACQGCGACAAVCPNSATILGDYEDNAILNSIEAALL